MAVALTGWAAGSLVVAGQFGAVPGSLCVLAFCALVALRGWQPVPVVVLASVLIALPAATHDLASVNADGVFVSLWLATILYSFALGTRCSWAVSVVGIAALMAGINISSTPFNPVTEMLIAGPWLAGLLVASRRRAAHQLAQRARELDDEREAYTAESVRYERARIARELHDIVAHCVSLMVVQASAGEKLTATDPHRAGESFTSISEAARQASDEIYRTCGGQPPRTAPGTSGGSKPPAYPPRPAAGGQAPRNQRRGASPPHTPRNQRRGASPPHTPRAAVGSGDDEDRSTRPPRGPVRRGDRVGRGRRAVLSR